MGSADVSAVHLPNNPPHSPGCFARVSSASWYFLNVFGLRSIYSLILGQDNGKKQSGLVSSCCLLGGVVTCFLLLVSAAPHSALVGEFLRMVLTDAKLRLNMGISPAVTEQYLLRV